MNKAFNTDYEACAHAFAHDHYESGYNYGNRMFFEDNTMYSYGYHYIIAKKVKNNLVLFNAYGNSATTNKQRWIVRRALSHFDSMEVVNFGSGKEAHKDNLNYYFSEATQGAKKQKRAKTINYIPDVLNALRDAKKYAELFRCKSLLTKSQKDLLEIEDEQELLIKVIGSHEAVQKAEKAKRTRAHKADLKRQEEAKVKWLAGDPKISAHQFRHDGDDLLRIVNLPLKTYDKNSEREDFVQTSQGITVPIDEAKRVFIFIAKLKNNGEFWKRNGKTFEINKSYQMDYVCENGDIQAGCHKIRWEQIEKIAKSQNWI